jgi:hypothetical protein
MSWRGWGRFFASVAVDAVSSSVLVGMGERDDGSGFLVVAVVVRVLYDSLLVSTVPGLELTLRTPTWASVSVDIADVSASISTIEKGEGYRLELKMYLVQAYRGTHQQDTIGHQCAATLQKLRRGERVRHLNLERSSGGVPGEIEGPEILRRGEMEYLRDGGHEMGRRYFR